MNTMKEGNANKTILDLGMKLRVAYNHDRSFLGEIVPYKNFIEGIYVTSNFKIFPSSGALIRDDINWDTYDEELGEIMRHLRGYGIKVYLLLNGTNFSPDIIKNYGKSELRKYLKKMVEKNGLEKIVIFSLPLGLKIKEDFPHIMLEVSTNAYVDSLEKAKYWAEYGKVEGICVHGRLNKRIDVLKQIKEQTGLRIAVIANDVCLVNCPNEICHRNFCTYEGGSATLFNCEGVISEKPWYAFHQRKIVPANLKYYEGIVDVIKLSGRTETTENMIKQVKQYATQLDSYEYPGSCPRTVFPLYPFYLPYMLGSEPPEVFEKVSKCLTNCEECGYCYKKWKEYYDLGDGIDYYISGYKKFFKGQYKEAMKEFNKYIEVDDKVNDEVYYYLGLCYKETGDYNKAIDFLKRAQGGNEIETAYNLGFCYYKSGQYEEAIDNLLISLRYVKDRHSTELVTLYLGLSYFELGEFKEALKYLERAESIKGEHLPIINFNIGNCYQGLQKYRMALLSYEKSLKETEVGGAEIFCQMGSCYIKLGEYANAISALQEVLKTNTDWWNVYNMMGVAYREVGKYDEAITALKKAVELSPQEWRNYNVLGNTYIKINKIKEGIEMLEKALLLCYEEQNRNNIKTKIESTKKQLK